MKILEKYMWENNIAIHMHKNMYKNIININNYISEEVSLWKSNSIDALISARTVSNEFWLMYN